MPINNPSDDTRSSLRERGDQKVGAASGEGRKQRKPWTPPRLETNSASDVNAAPPHTNSAQDGTTSYTS